LTLTSNTQQNECYVYITLPGQTNAVAAGRFVLTVDRRGMPLGRFVYGKRYLENPDAVALDPVELKLTDLSLKKILPSFFVACVLMH